MNLLRRPGLSGAVLALTIVGAPLLALAATAGTARAPQVASAATGYAIPALPEPAPDASGPSGVPEALPLVPSDSSGRSPRAARVRYMELSLNRPDDAVAMVGAATAELVVPATAVDDVNAFEQVLMFSGSLEEPLDPDSGEPVDASGPVALGDVAFERLAERAMTALGATPENVVGVNDLAVAMFALGLATQGDEAATGPDGADFADHDHLKRASIMLLDLAAGTFDGERSVAINLAYLRSLEPRSEGAPAGSIQPLVDLLARSPKDATARFLLASIQARRLDIDGLDLALAAADPLLADPSTLTLGHLARGDAYLARADIRRPESPFLARSMATSALAEYDEAIRQSGDAGAYAGRAVALDLLGEPAAAVEAQAAAVAIDPGSAAAGLRLAELQGCAGDDTDRRASADAALAAAGADPVKFAAARFIWTGDEDHDQPIVDRGYLGYSIGSARASWPVEWFPPAFTGGFIISTAAFDEPDTCLTLDETGLLERAAVEGLAASIGLRDVASAERTYGTWLEHAPPLQAPDPDPDAEPEPRPIPEGLAAATRLLTGGTPGPQTDPASAVLAVRSRLAPDVAADICGLLAATEPDPTAESVSFKDELLVCVAEAADRRGDVATAATTMQGVIRVEAILDDTMANRFLQTGTLMEATGEGDEALHLYRLAASVQRTNIAGLAKIGDLELSRGDPDAAISAYRLALSGLEVVASQQTEFGQRNAVGERRLEQYLHNNEGVALLMLARSEPGEPPDCISNADACREAAAAFVIAIDSDPDNWVYLMNAGWAARLSGQPAAAVSFLQRALANSPAIPWAIQNDLGVLAARTGDLVAARAAFEGALASDPTYDLARWNLGVLESGAVGFDLAKGQRLLSDAVRSNAELRADPLAYLPDDRVYRIEVRSPDRLALAVAPGNGSALSAVAFGTIAAVGALARFATAFGGPLQEAIAIAAAGIGGRRLRLRTVGRIRVGAHRLGVGWRSWFIWFPSFVVLIATTVLSVGKSAPDAFATTLLATLAATVLALVVHAAGHLVVARRVSAGVRPARWDPGIVMALIGIPFQLAAGPFLAERVRGVDPLRSWWASAAGILANVAAAGVAYLAYLVDPLPFLRILVAVQLAVAAYALIPSDPLDGDRLARYPIVLALMALGVATASLALAVGAV